MEIKRTKERIDKTGEIFTPTELVKEIFEKFPKDAFIKPEKTFIDPACGDGNFLIEVLKNKLSNGHAPSQALSTIYGIDIMEDNVAECRRRLLVLAGPNEENTKLVNKNIKIGDSLKIANFDTFFN